MGTDVGLVARDLVLAGLVAAVVWVVVAWVREEE